MKKSLVTPTLIKQKARQLKKERSIKLHNALDEIVLQYGFSNYKHYLNHWESNQSTSSQSEVETFLSIISKESVMSKKVMLAIPFVQNHRMSVAEMFDFFECFRSSPKDLQIVCENTYQLDHIVSTMLLQYFQQSKADVQALPLMQHFVANNIVVEDLKCEIITERLNVKGLYTVEFEFEFQSEIDPDMKQMPHFNRDPMFGEFEMTLSRNKQATIANPTIGQLSDDGSVYMTKLKLGQSYLDEIKRIREESDS